MGEKSRTGRTGGTKPSKTALFSAAKRWDSKSLDALLSSAPSLIDATDPRGRKALHIACSIKPGTRGTLESNGIRTVLALFRHGADLHDYVPLEEGSFKATPIWYAVAHGDNLPLVKMLLKRGARADNCLYAVVWNDNADVLREILKTNPPLDDVQAGEPVIISAIRWRKLKTLDMLIDAGADLSFLGAKGRDAVFHAKRKKLPSSMLARLQTRQSTT
jgi:ankyrin repeat protein